MQSSDRAEQAIMGKPLSDKHYCSRTNVRSDPYGVHLDEDQSEPI